MVMTTANVTLCAILLLLAVHLTVTYLASERLNVFTSLCMLSMLPAFATGMLAATITFFATRNPTLAASVGMAAFAVLVLPYTGQAIWELISGQLNPRYLRPRPASDRPKDGKQGPPAR
jgi:hypothetical protein